MRIAIYARVSTLDKGQDPENQLRELRAWCSNSGHTISREYVEHESGRKGADKRRQFAALFEDAAKRKFDCVLFWALDRFSREGMVQTIAHLQRLASHGVSFHSYTEPHLATDNELVRNVLLALLSSLARLEAQRGSATAPGRVWLWLELMVSKLVGPSLGLTFGKRSSGLPPRVRRHMQLQDHCE
jgi:DNA invertase Pin-like site-specific DNA recombinase